LNNHQYKQPLKPSTEALFKDRGSKFFGYVFPVFEENAIQQALDDLKGIHPKARHFCYAWQLGETYDRYRVNDDGEPSNSAGMPIYGQIQSMELTHCLIVVVRYFGGTKLGVGGLINAYKTAASMALDQTKIETKDISKTIKVYCGYDLMNEVMRLVKEYNLNISKQELTTDCSFYIDIPLQIYEEALSRFKSVYGLQLEL